MPKTTLRTDMNPLGLEPHHGCAVTEIAASIDNAGKALKDSLEVDTDVIDTVAGAQIGDTFYFLIRVDCTGDGYKTVKGDEGHLRYTPSFHATDTILVDSAYGSNTVNAQRDRIRRLRDEAEGRVPMFDENGEIIEHMGTVFSIVGDGGAQ